MVITQRSNGSEDTHYLHKDTQGSVGLITDEHANVVSQSLYDPFGKQTKLQQASFLSNFTYSEVSHQGYTGHHMLNDVGIIHMKGRIYDPSIGRFMQADPFIQAPENTQNYNRYSYVLNNPMSMTDPSGYNFLRKAAGFLTNGILEPVFRAVPELRFVSNVVGCAVGNVMQCGAIVFGNAIASGASITGAFRSSVTSMISVGVFQGIGGSFTGAAEGGPGHILAHATAGGAMSVLQGGKFGHGFLSAGFTKAASVAFLPDGKNLTGNQIFYGTVVSAVIGGTVSKLSGGKFANGAQTGAFQYLFNQVSTRDKWESQTENNRSTTVTNPVTGQKEEVPPNFHPIRDSEGNYELGLDGRVKVVHHEYYTKYVVPFGDNAILLNCLEMTQCTDSLYLTDSPTTNLQKPRINSNSILNNPIGVKIVGNGWYMMRPGPTVVITGLTKVGEVMWCSNMSDIQAACGG